MARMRNPLVEVTAPDGSKSLWAAIAIPHKEAVAAVKKMIPPGYIVELSVRKFPPGLKIDGVYPGNVIQIE